MRREIRQVAVYCSSSDHVAPAYFELARALGAAIARRGWGIVYGGGRVGLMGAVADAALAEGGAVVGVITRQLHTHERAHTGLSQLYVVDGMPLRKSMMMQLADAFIALPGGFGTWEELLEAATQGLLRAHHKPLAVLDPHGDYAPLRAMIEAGVEGRFVRPEYRSLVRFFTEPTPLLDALTQAAWPHDPERSPPL